MTKVAARMDPRRVVEIHPVRASRRMAKVVNINCVPVPTAVQNSVESCGYQKTSPWISFHLLYGWVGRLMGCIPRMQDRMEL